MISKKEIDEKIEKNRQEKLSKGIRYEVNTIDASDYKDVYIGDFKTNRIIWRYVKGTYFSFENAKAQAQQICDFLNKRNKLIP